MFQTPIQLGPSDVLRERPFTHPSHTFADLYVLRYMAEQLHQTVNGLDVVVNDVGPAIIHKSEADTRPHRLVLIHPEMLAQPSRLTVVGFFGQRREGVDLAQLNEMDNILLTELKQHPGLISYSSLNLYNENSSNLVLFADEAAKERWGESQMHRQAVELSREHYHSIRIYNGFLPEGAQKSSALRITKVRYFDYTSNPFWLATRLV